ncbi:CBU_0592 family membrane protein [Puia dinghuensis]|uniref:CBU-0592-like domain-containing protein n=1 Tax=Puia dinghuensis TaxID=1792502 RepID=A0A8J2UI22_9BACT|nr:hypothetical protein [Puia dinghuensis]GGB21047.1 hypothetical protein GCM10011511_50990 [Puia dinghuensis]
MLIVDIVGWFGSILVVAAYALNIYGKLSSASTPYYVLNIAGSTALIINTLYHHAIPSMVVNVVWIGIALVALFKRAKKEIAN